MVGIRKIRYWCDTLKALSPGILLQMNESENWVRTGTKLQCDKVGCVFPMVIWPDFRMWQQRDDDPREDALHFTNRSSLRLSKSSLSMTSSSVYSMQTTVAVRVHLLARATSPKHPPRSIRIGSACVKTPSPRGSFVMPTFPKLLWFSKIFQYPAQQETIKTMPDEIHG